MSGVHDMGGVKGFGPVAPDPNEPLFHETWERDVLATTLAMGARGLWNLDESRHARESIPAADYLSIGYYRIWLQALEDLLQAKGVVKAGELDEFVALGTLPDSDVNCPKPVLKAASVSAALAAGAPVDRALDSQAVFYVGQRVKACRPSSSETYAQGHTRLPQYVHGHCGVIVKVHGSHVFADAHAAGAGEQPQWLYNVRFDAQTLWGKSSARGVHVDCWEPYLEAVSDD